MIQENNMTTTYGIHASVFVGGWSPEETRSAVRRAADAGYDLLEVTASDLSEIDPNLLGEELRSAGMQASASLGLGFDRDVNNEDPQVVQRGVDFLVDAVGLMEGLGSDYLCGCLYSTLGKYSAPATPKARANAVAALREVARAASERGIRLGVEVVNRYETNLFNTVRDALGFIDEVGEDNVYLHLDTYHANIEEGDLRRPVLDAGDRLAYVHIGESHRGYLGSGTIDFPAFFRALVETGYAGPITFESFSSAVVDPALSNNLAVWRNLWDDGDDLARHALRFMKDGMQAARACYGKA
jgi:D-psicose/D-tagatose/L-ribulose 3-epimerase